MGNTLSQAVKMRSALVLTTLKALRLEQKPNNTGVRFMSCINLADCPAVLNEQVVMLEKLMEYQFMASATLEIALQADFTQVNQVVIHNFMRLQDHFAKESSRLTERLLSGMLKATQRL